MAAGVGGVNRFFRIGNTAERLFYPLKKSRYSLSPPSYLARKISWVEPLSPFFNIPIDSMFSGRTIVPLLRFCLKWEDYPKEPTPFDGTILHAIERLLPFAAHAAGFRYATASVPGITW